MTINFLGYLFLLGIAIAVCTCANTTLYVTTGSTARLVCPLLDSVITWTGPPGGDIIAVDETVNKDDLHVLKNRTQFTLEIKLFTEKNEGSYACQTFQADYLFSVVLLKAPSNMTIANEAFNRCVYGYEGRNLYLTCRVVSGTPNGTIYWIYNNKVVQTSNSSSVTYVFQPSAADDLGEFSCEANNSLILQRNIKICLRYPPNVRISPGPFVKVVEGNRVELKCNYISNIAITHISWVYDGDKTFSWLNTSHLNLASINRTQAGEYACTVENQAGAVTANVTIEVMYQPDVSISYSNTGDKRKLKCNAAGVPDRYEFNSWEHKTEFGEHLRFLISSNTGIVYIPNIINETNRHLDRGIYVCNVSNNISFDGRTYASAEYWLNIAGKPYFVKSNMATQYGIAKQYTELTADIVTFKMPINFAFFNDTMLIDNTNNAEEVPVRDTMYGKNVLVKGIRLTFPIFIQSIDDFRLYTVVVNNTNGSSTYTINLSSASRPDPPVLVHLIPMENEIAISWIPGFNGGYQQNFFIEYRSKISKSWETVNASNASTTIVKHLEPGMEYFIRMFSQNIINASDYTRQYLVETETDRRYGVIVAIIFVLVLLITISCLVYQYKTGKLKDIRNSSCIRFFQDIRVEGIGGVENGLYENQNNLQQQPLGENPDIPVYSSIDRRMHLSIGNAVSYSVTKKRKPNPLRPRMRQKSNDDKKTNISETSASNENGEQELNYIEVCFDQKPNNHPFKIHGLEQKTDYIDIDFTKKVDHLPDSDKDDISDDGVASVEVLKSMKRKTKNLNLP